MPRGPLVVFIAVLCLAALPVARYLTEPREAVSSTPSDYTGLTKPLLLPERSELCADEILFDTNSGIARFGATSDVPAPALTVTARGYADGEYESTARLRGGWTGTRQFDVPLRPPGTPVLGTFCLRNASNVPIHLVGSEDGRAYSRPSVTVNGEPTPLELQLRLLEPGRHSVLSRVGRITAQAATLKPFGAWWWWVLGLTLLTLAPLGVALALRSALVAEPGRLAAPAGSWPDLTGVRRRLAAIPGWGLVAAAMAVAIAWFCYWSFETHVFQNDEDQYVYLSRWLQTEFPGSLFQFERYGRGLQRLEVWLLAIPSALFDAPWSLRGGRLLNAIAFASTAIPVYLVARRLAVRPAWAALAAALSIAVPWAVVTTAFLTENVAYPAFMWVIWAFFAAATAPRWWRDLLALVLLLVAGAARSGLLVVAPVLPVVVAATALRCGHGLRRLLREHVVLWAAVAAGLLALVAGPLGFEPAAGLVERVAGGYATTTNFELSQLLEKWARYLSKVVLGTGFFAAAVGLPWLAIQLVRAREPARFAFAALVGAGTVAMLYGLNAAGPDERYVLYFAPFVLIPAAAALSHRELSAAGLAIASVLLAVLLLRVPWNPAQGGFGFFISSAEMFYANASLRIDRYLPGDDADVRVLFAVALGAAGVAMALNLRRFSGVAGAALVAAVALSVPVQAQYTLSKHVNGVGSRSGPSLRERAFADTLVPKGATVGEFTEGVAQEQSFFGIWYEVQFYNERIDAVYALHGNRNVWPPGDRLIEGVGFDERTGRVTSPEPLPDYLVIPTQVGAVRLRGEVVSAPAYIPVALLRVAQPPTLDWRANGFGTDGTITGDEGGQVWFYGTGLRPAAHCASFQLLASPEERAEYRFVRDDREVITGVVEPGEAKSVQFLLADLAEHDSVEIRVFGADMRVAGVDLVEGCGS